MDTITGSCQEVLLGTTVRLVTVTMDQVKEDTLEGGTLEVEDSEKMVVDGSRSEKTPLETPGTKPTRGRPAGKGGVPDTFVFTGVLTPSSFISTVVIVTVVTL